MKITILNTSIRHPVNAMLQDWVKENEEYHDVKLVHCIDDISGGDLLFLISCNVIINKEIRKKFVKTLVIHASDLPKGRGWSPHVWDIIRGKEEIIVSLLEAEDKVDSGDIWKKISVSIPKNYLYDEINSAIFEAEKYLINYAVDNFYSVKPSKQENHEATFFKKRTPEDSRLNPDETIKDQFDLIRVCDPDRYPAFFELHGSKYKIYLEKF